MKLAVNNDKDMITNTLKIIFLRDLNALTSEMETYQNEANLWRIEKGITNSAGNLCLHLLGNLNHFIGAEIGKTGYIRDRDAEFSLKNIARIELLTQIESTKMMIETVLDKIDEAVLIQESPKAIFGENSTVQDMLLHLITHLRYHLGQINYHRRLIDC